MKRIAFARIIFDLAGTSSPGTLELYDWPSQRGIWVDLNTGKDRITAGQLG